MLSCYQRLAFVCVILGLVQLQKIASIETRIGLIEFLLSGVVNREIPHIKDELKRLDNKVTDQMLLPNGQTKQVNITERHEVEELLTDVAMKTNRMIRAFSGEKRQLQDLSKRLLHFVLNDRETVNSISGQTVVLADKMTFLLTNFDQLLNQHDKAKLSMAEIRQQMMDTATGQENQITNIQMRLDELEKQTNQDRQENRKYVNATEQHSNALRSDVDEIKRSIKEKTPCKSNWIRNKDSCFLYVKDIHLTWIESQKVCKDHGGHLVEVDADVVLAFLRKNNPDILDDDYRLWVGASDRLQDGKWVWESTLQLASVTWLANEPSNEFNGKREDCMDFVFHKTGVIGMNDHYCDYHQNFICEMKL